MDFSIRASMQPRTVRPKLGPGGCFGMGKSSSLNWVKSVRGIGIPRKGACQFGSTGETADTRFDRQRFDSLKAVIFRIRRRGVLGGYLGRKAQHRAKLI